MQPNIDEISLSSLKGTEEDNEDLCTLECTVATGFEEISAAECREVFGVKTIVARGRVIFDIDINLVPKVLKLRSIENVNVILHILHAIELMNEDRKHCFRDLYKLAEAPDWNKGLRVLKEVEGIHYDGALDHIQPLGNGYCIPRPDIDLKGMKIATSDRLNIPKNILSQCNSKTNEETSESNEETNKSTDVIQTHDEDLSNYISSACVERVSAPSFRVSCYRSGSKHCFVSQEAARQLGAGVNERLGWPVKLKDYQIDIILNIVNELGYVSLELTKVVLFKRNLVSFGRTNLRATLCYNMIRLADPKIGDIIIDPMCGGASIPVEGALTYPHAFHLGGDIHIPSINRGILNIDHVNNLHNKSLPIGLSNWDSTKLPIRDQSIDVIITDLPFGKRIGRRLDNRVLYFRSLVEFARVTRVGTGRAVMLTHDRSNMLSSLKRVGKLWKSSTTRTINIGGLFAGVFTLLRSDLLFDNTLNLNPKLNKQKKRENKDTANVESQT